MIDRRAFAVEALVSGALAALLWVGAARAESQTVRMTSFLHIGPGRQYAVTDEVPTAASVEVGECREQWCQVRFGGSEGWLDRRMLAGRGDRAGALPSGRACLEYARTGWPAGGDLERLCLAAAAR